MDYRGRGGAALLLALVLIPGCGGSGAAKARVEVPPGPILILGLDGMEWRVVLPMIRAGQLPALSRLMSEGVYGKLETFQPTISPVIWTSVVTGKKLEKHGIMDVLKKDPSGGPPTVYSSTDRKTKALWNIFTDYGLKVDTVGWWKTFPVEKINGIMVPQLDLLFRFDPSGVGVFDPTRAQTYHGLAYPKSYEDHARQVAIEAHSATIRIAEDIFGRFKHPHSELGLHLLAALRWVITTDAIQIRLAKEILEQNKPYDLFLFYERGSDVVGHEFWRFYQPAGFKYPPTRDEIENYSDFIPAYYRYVDRAVGSLLKAAGPQATVFVLSDHGMEATHLDKHFSADFPHPESMSGDHQDAPPGIFIASGPHIAKAPGEKFDPGNLTYDKLPVIGSVLDVTPTILALKGLPIGRDMDGKVLEAILDPAFLKAHPPAYEDTHDTKEWLESRSSYHLPPDEQKDLIEEMRSLGYIH